MPVYGRADLIGTDRQISLGIMPGNSRQQRLEVSITQHFVHEACILTVSMYFNRSALRRESINYPMLRLTSAASGTATETSQS